MVLYITIESFVSERSVRYNLARESDLTNEHVSWLEYTRMPKENENDNRDSEYGFLTMSIYENDKDDPEATRRARDEGKRLFSQSYDVPILKNGQVITRIYSQTFDENGQFIS